MFHPPGGLYKYFILFSSFKSGIPLRNLHLPLVLCEGARHPNLHPAAIQPDVAMPRLDVFKGAPTPSNTCPLQRDDYRRIFVYISSNHPFFRGDMRYVSFRKGTGYPSRKRDNLTDITKNSGESVRNSSTLLLANSPSKRPPRRSYYIYILYTSKWNVNGIPE